VSISFEEGHLGAESLQGLGKLTTNGATTYHAQPLRALSQSKNALIGQTATLGQPRNGWHTGVATRCNHGPCKDESLPFDFKHTRAGKMTVAEEDVYAQRREALHRIVGTEVSPQAPQAFHNGGEIDLQVTVVVHAIVTRISHVSPGSGATQQCLTGDTAVVETVPTHKVPFDQSHARSQPSGASRGNEAGRASTDDHQVIRIAGDRILPIAGMRLRQQAGIVRIFWQDLDRADCGMRDNGHIPLLRVARS
jgi:hypothetical protein